MATADRTVVFVHGLWLHADSWTGWVDRFRDEGYARGARVARRRRHRGGHEEVARARRRVRHRRRGRPLRADHRRPRLEADRRRPLVRRPDRPAAARAEPRRRAVAIDPAPIKGVLRLPPSALRVASIALRNPANRKKAVSLTAQQFRYGFGNQLSAAGRTSSTSAGRSRRRAAALRGGFAAVSPQLAGEGRHRQPTRGPLLVTAGRQRPHGAGHDQPPDGQALPQVFRRHRPEGVPRSWPLPRRSTAAGTRSQAR